MRYGLALRHVSSLPNCFHSFQHSSMCQRQRAMTSASSTESSAFGTLVTRIVQSSNCMRAWPVFLHLRCRCRLARAVRPLRALRSEEHTSELQSHLNIVCRLLLEKK